MGRNEKDRTDRRQEAKEEGREEGRMTGDVMSRSILLITDNDGRY